MSKARLLPVLLRITRLFYLEIPAPLDMAAMERALHFSVSICLPPSDSIAPSFSTPTPTWSHKNVVEQKKKDFIVDGRVCVCLGMGGEVRRSPLSTRLFGSTSVFSGHINTD